MWRCRHGSAESNTILDPMFVTHAKICQKRNMPWLFGMGDDWPVVVQYSTSYTTLMINFKFRWIPYWIYKQSYQLICLRSSNFYPSSIIDHWAFWEVLLPYKSIQSSPTVQGRWHTATQCKSLASVTNRTLFPFLYTRNAFLVCGICDDSILDSDILSSQSDTQGDYHGILYLIIFSALTLTYKT